MLWIEASGIVCKPQSGGGVMDMLEKKYYKIKDVAEMLGVSQSAIRYWESEFPECRPRRNAHNIRYYTPEVIEKLRIVHYLLKVKGLKLEAAKEQMRTNTSNISRRIEVIERLEGVRNDLSGLLKALRKRGSALGISDD